MCVDGEDFLRGCWVMACWQGLDGAGFCPGAVVVDAGIVGVGFGRVVG